MINAIIKGIFKLITSFFTILMTPIISFVTNLFPDLSNIFSYISTYLTYCFTYVRSILHLLLIPDELIIFLFDYFIICSTIYYGVIAYRFALNIYNKYKV